eukprot:c3186_g1_i2.p1 GENE.c3186_g1_i2~~c3186_g1_i2.p1  ORF type:complete len:406 (-),score=71.88 c3186_g1_i2:29-1084(-)
MFTGVGLFPHNSAAALRDSMLNFLALTSEDGQVPGCLTPNGPSKTLKHAKPVIIQGAWLASKYLGPQSISQLRSFSSQMSNLLSFWDTQRRHSETGLYVWFDQMESGADNLVLSQNETDQLNTSAPDVMVFLFREHISFSRFLRAWAEEETEPTEKERLLDQAIQHESTAQAIKDAIFKWLWFPELNYFGGFDVKSMTRRTNRTFLMAFPLWEPLLMSGHEEKIDLVVSQVRSADMWTKFGVRSTSSSDSLYNNENIIVPYSNWQGPIWICSNTVIAYALNNYDRFHSDAVELAHNIVELLAADLRETQVWHECYHGDTGQGLAAPGFLSWNVLGGSLLQNIEANVNPFAL